VSIVGPSETGKMLSVIADKSSDSPIEFPLISLKRPGGFTVLSTGSRPLSHSGSRIFANSEVGKRLRAIPISIPYQIDIYTRYRDEADEYARNIVYNIINYPRLDITIPYHEENFVHYSNIHMAGEVDDTSDIPERLSSGQFVRLSIQIVVDDAYLFDIQYKKTKKVCPSCVTIEVADN
jgi:hypothetical protein